MSFREKIAGKEIYILLFLAGLINLVIFRNLYGFHPNNDTEGFLYLIEVFRGYPEAPVYAIRYLNPFYAVWGSKIMFFVTPAQSMIVANIIFYFGILFLMYGLVRRVFKNTYIAVFSSLIMITTYPMIRYLLTQVQDIGAYFWFTLTLYAGWRWFEDKNKLWLLLGGVAVSFGLLTKENGAMGALFVGMLFLLRKISWKQRIVSFLQFSAFPFLTLVVNYFRSKDLNINSLDWFISEWKFDRVVNFKFSTWLGVNVNTFNFLWLFIIIGLFLIIKNWKTIDQNIRTYIIAVFIPAFSYFAWPVYISRTVIICGWLFIPIASYAIYTIYAKGAIYKKIALSILVLAMVAPYVLQSTIRYAHLPAIIADCNNSLVCTWDYFWANRDSFSKIR